MARGRAWVRDWKALVGALVLVLAAAGYTLDGLLFPGAGELLAPDAIQVIDGDTFRIGDERVRVENRRTATTATAHPQLSNHVGRPGVWWLPSPQ